MSHSKYKMIAIDMDGTLLSPMGEVTPRTKQAIHRALEAGLLVCFATGRNWTESETVLEAVAHYDSAVFVGGAMVVDTKQRITLHRTMMNPQLAREVSAVMEAAGHAVLALQDKHTAGRDYLITGDFPVTNETARWMKLTKSRAGIFIPKARETRSYSTQCDSEHRSPPEEEVFEIKLKL